MYFGCVCFRGELGFLNCDDICVMRVLLFVLHVCLLRECDGARLMAMLVWRMDEV